MTRIFDSEHIYRQTLQHIKPETLLFHFFRGDERARPPADSQGQQGVSGLAGLPGLQGQPGLADNSPIYIIGSGKASTTMALAMEGLFGDRIAGGMVIDSVRPAINPKRIEVLKGSHPLPDEASLASTEALLTYCAAIPAGAAVYNLVSGGTSSLLVKPVAPITLPDLQVLYKLLITSGAEIQEINTVRKSVSEVKGGRLLAHLRHTRLTDLIISDIPDDDLSMVGSGPSIAQSFSPAEAVAVCKRRGIWAQLPDRVQMVLADRVSAGDVRVEDVEGHRVIQVLSARQMATRAATQAERLGYRVWVRNAPFSGPMRVLEHEILGVAGWLMPDLVRFDEGVADPFAHFLPFGEARVGMATDSGSPGRGRETRGDDSRGYAFVFYGECTLKIEGDGLGGRNQELALRIGQHLFGRVDENADGNAETNSGLDRLEFLSAGTDGIDGPTDAAGGVVTAALFRRAAAQGLRADTFLARNDSTRFFEQAGGHIKPGPTGNNVMDLQLLLVRT